MSIPMPGASSAPGGGVPRYVAILRLQSQLHALRPGSFAYEVADHAISLALSNRRPAHRADYLERSVRRDARRILARAGRRTFTDPLTHDTPLGRAAEAGMHASLVEMRTPELVLAGMLLLCGIQTRVRAELGERGIRALAGLLEGETLDETGAALGISPRTLDRLRAGIRRITLEFLASEDA